MSNSKEPRRWDPKSKEGQLLTQMQTQLKRADAVFATFAAKLTDYQDPDNALSNADRVFEANGQRNIAVMIIDTLTRVDSISTFETVRTFAAERLINLGMSVEHSSGKCHNHVESFNLAAWTRLCESMKWI